MDEIKRSYSREELHELVWSTPIQTLAAKFGLSDRGLAKTCERHLVPVPGRGYWARIEAGQSVKRTPLRAVENTALQTVRIGSKPERFQSQYVAEALAKAQAEMEREDRSLNSRPIAEPPQDRSSRSKIDTPNQSSIHPDVRRFLNELRLQKVDRDGFIYLKGVKVSPADVMRIGSLISAIASELSLSDFAFHDGDNSLGFVKQKTKVNFWINAPRKRVTNTSDKSWYRFDYHHVGRLTLEINGWAKGVGKNWSDTDTRKIEQSLPKIIESFRINFVAERDREEERRREEEHRARMARRREMSSLRAKRETDRLEFLRWIADARREVDDLRATISAVPQEGNLPSEYERMIDWAKIRLTRLEAETAVEKIQAILVEKMLYPDPDNLFDPEGDPPPKTNYWDD